MTYLMILLIIYVILTLSETKILFKVNHWLFANHLIKQSKRRIREPHRSA